MPLINLSFFLPTRYFCNKYLCLIFHFNYLFPKHEKTPNIIHQHNRSSNGAMISVSHAKTSIVIGQIIKMDLVILPKSFGWEMRTFTCWPTMRIMHCVLNWKISKGTKGKCHWILRNRDLHIVWANLNMRIIL